MATQTTREPGTAFPPIPRQGGAPAAELVPGARRGKRPHAGPGPVPFPFPDRWEEDDDEDEADEVTADGDDRWPLVPGRRQARRDSGMATAEYAVATLAACGFAGVLLAVVRSGEVQQMLLAIIRRALMLE